MMARKSLRISAVLVIVVSLPLLYLLVTTRSRAQVSRMSLERLREETARRPEDWRLYLALGERLRQTGELEEASTAILHAYNLRREDPALVAALASMRLVTNDIAGADRLLSEAERKWPRSPEVLAQTAQLDLQRGRYLDALNRARRAVRYGPRQLEAWQVRARAASANKLTREAAHGFQRALQLAPEHAEVLSDYGEFLSKYGQVAAAETALRRAASLAPRSPRALGLLGVHLNAYARDSKQRREAIDILQRAITLAPKASDPRYHLGLALIYEGRPEEAIPPLQVCVEIDPTLVEARLALAQAFAAAGRPKDAEREFTAFREISELRRDFAQLEVRLRRQPKNRKLLLSMARLQERHGLLAKAVAHYRRALEVSDDPELRKHVEQLEGQLDAPPSR